MNELKLEKKIAGWKAEIEKKYGVTPDTIFYNGSEHTNFISECFNSILDIEHSWSSENTYYEARKILAAFGVTRIGKNVYRAYSDNGRLEVLEAENLEPVVGNNPAAVLMKITDSRYNNGNPYFRIVTYKYHP